VISPGKSEGESGGKKAEEKMRGSSIKWTFNYISFRSAPPANARSTINPHFAFNACRNNR